MSFFTTKSVPVALLAASVALAGPMSVPRHALPNNMPQCPELCLAPILKGGVRMCDAMNDKRDLDIFNPESIKEYCPDGMDPKDLSKYFYTCKCQMEGKKPEQGKPYCHVPKKDCPMLLPPFYNPWSSSSPYQPSPPNVHPSNPYGPGPHDGPHGPSHDGSYGPGPHHGDGGEFQWYGPDDHGDVGLGDKPHGGKDGDKGGKGDGKGDDGKPNLPGVPNVPGKGGKGDEGKGGKGDGADFEWDGPNGQDDIHGESFPDDGKDGDKSGKGDGKPNVPSFPGDNKPDFPGKPSFPSDNKPYGSDGGKPGFSDVPSFPGDNKPYGPGPHDGFPGDKPHGPDGDKPYGKGGKPGKEPSLGDIIDGLMPEGCDCEDDRH